MIGQQLLSLLYGDPADQISRAINPAPNPNPGAPPPVGAQGGAPGSAPPAAAGGGPSGSPSAGPQPPQPPMAPANATQSPPDLASLYVKLHQQDMAANQVDRGLALAASAFGTAQQQHDMLNYAQRLQPDDRAALMGQAMLGQKELTQQQEHSRFMAGSAAMGKLLNIDQPTAAWAMNNEDVLKDMLAVHAANTTKTNLEKEVDAAATTYAQAHPGTTPEDLASFKSRIYTLSTDPAAKEAATVQAKEVQEFKDNAATDYTPVTSKLREQQDNIRELLRNPDDTVSAIKAVLPVTGQYARANIIDTQAVKDKAVLLEKVRAALTGSGLTDVKNVRNRREFDVLGHALTAGLDPAASPEALKQALGVIQNKILDARATAELAAGHKLTGELVGHGNRDLLIPSNPFYNGATEETKGETPTTAASGGKHYVWTPDGGLQER